MRKRRVKIKKLTTKQFRAMQNTIENRCCNYLSERCVLYDDGDYPLCVQHGLRYLVCPYFRDVVIHNNAELMEELLEIPKMQINVASVENSLCRHIVTACIAPSAGRKSLLRKHANDLKNTGIRKSQPSRLLKKK